MLVRSEPAGCCLTRSIGHSQAGTLGAKGRYGGWGVYDEKGTEFSSDRARKADSVRSPLVKLPTWLLSSVALIPAHYDLTSSSRNP